MTIPETLSDPYGDDAMLPGEYVGLPGMTPEEVAAEKARWKAIAAELDRTRTTPKRDWAALFAAKPGDPLFEELCRIFDWQDCRGTPFKDPRQAPNFDTLPDHLKQALGASARRPDQTDLARD